MLNLVLVDDEERIRQGIMKILSKSEPDVTVIGSFANGLQAYEFIMNAAPEAVDLVITDIKMPVMDGLKLIGSLKELRPLLRFVLVSGFNDFEYARQGIKYGVADYLLKPVDVDELHLILERVARERAAVSGTAGAEFPASPPSNGGSMAGGTAAGIEEKGSHRVAERVKAIIDKEYRREIGLSELAEAVYVTPYHLSKLFRRETGETVTDYLISVRIAKAKMLLEFQPELKVFEVGAYVGYQDAAYFNKLFKRIVGATPKEFKDRLL